MTNREFYTAILSAPVSEEIKGYAQSEIAKLDNRNEKRRATLTKEQIANESIKASILAFVGAHPKAIASEIATACEISTQKVSALAKLLSNDGKLTVCEVAIKGKGKVKAYTAVEVVAE